MSSSGSSFGRCESPGGSDSRIGQKPVDEHDQAVLEKVERLRVSGFPSAELPLKQMVHGTRLGPKGFTRAHHLWSDRALASLAVLWSWARRNPIQALPCAALLDRAGILGSVLDEPLRAIVGKLGSRKSTSTRVVSTTYPRSIPNAQCDTTSKGRSPREGSGKRW